MKKLISLLLITSILIACFALTACTGGETQEGYKDPTEELVVNTSEDKYRNFYHIWVCSFEDTDGDETGDLNGIIEKLDYLNDGDPDGGNDLGIDGIWLSPIMPSDSYHKYDVDDYMDIDPEFGTLEDFDRLISECDKRGITVILDLVLNHCGTGHEFFQKAMAEAKEGNLDGYARYYKFATGGFPGEGYRSVVGAPSLWYEGQFSFEMPDWNLAYEGTREYFEEVAKFWLDRGVGGFRLDAVKYMTDDETDGVEFLNWFYTTAQKYNPDVYMVGENWQGNSELYKTYESGIDSQFAFSFATASGNIATAVNSGNGKQLSSKLKKFEDNSRKANENVIHAMFLSNHDTMRSANYFPAGLSNQKMAAAVYMLIPGNSFTYYGEEIGTMTPSGYSGNDAYFRAPMNWDDDVEPEIWCTGNAFAEYDYGGVKQQIDDPDSLLSFYRRIIKIKNQNPELARGEITEALDFDNSSICAYKVEYEGKELLVIHNLDKENSATVSVTEDMLKNPVIRGDLYAQTAESTLAEGETSSAEAANTAETDTAAVLYVTLKGTELSLPAQSSAVLMAQ
ncbi:MAG: alpha-amylase family glycosyl hydrolase [Ruminococcus sp.]